MSDEIVLYPTNRKVNDAGEVLIPNLNALEQRVKELEAKLATVERERDAYKQDIHDEAGLLMVDVPEPGTDMAKVMRANRLMRHSRDRLREALRAVEMELDGRYDGAPDSSTRWMGALLTCVRQALGEG